MLMALTTKIYEANGCRWDLIALPDGDTVIHMVAMGGETDTVTLPAAALLPLARLLPAQLPALVRAELAGLRRVTLQTLKRVLAADADQTTLTWEALRARLEAYLEIDLAPALKELP
jgi:hypothetical protein